MFQFKDVTVTLDNYMEIFRGCDLLFLDEVYIALVQGVDIEEYISVDSPYKLAELRVNKRVGIPKRFNSISFKAETLGLIRLAVASNSMRTLNSYISPNGDLTISEDVFDLAIRCELENKDIHLVDLYPVNTGTAKLFCFNVLRGMPIMLFKDYLMNMSEEKLSILLKGLLLGCDTTLLTDSDWGIEEVELILSRPSLYQSVISLVSPKYSIGQLRAVIDCLSSNLDVNNIIRLDISGKPIYDALRMATIVDAMKLNIYDENIHSDLSVNVGSLIAMNNKASIWR